jgi:hypothetical protein
MAHGAWRTAGRALAVKAAVTTSMQYCGSRILRSAVGEVAAAWQVIAATIRYGVKVSEGATICDLQSAPAIALVASEKARTVPAAVTIDARLMVAPRLLHGDGAANAACAPRTTLVSIK